MPPEIAQTVQQSPRTSEQAGKSPDHSLFSEADTHLLDEIQRRAFLYFWERADAHTGLVTDRARNDGTDNYEVASIAATGYALAALPIGVERGWITRRQGQERALRTLDFVGNHLAHEHGWFYHFLDRRTGKRVWKSEISSMDTALLLMGALTCGEYFNASRQENFKQSHKPNFNQNHNQNQNRNFGEYGEASGTFRSTGSNALDDVRAITTLQRRVSELVGRVDWTWMRTCGGQQPKKLTLAHGWKPGSRFLPYNWDQYNEGILLTLLGLGAEGNSHAPLPAASWQAWTRNVYTQDGIETLAGGPIFLHQMAQGFYDFRGRRDRFGYDYWVSAQNGVAMHRQFCLQHAPTRKTYALGFWGLNASDGPRGYKAYGIATPEDGTIAPNGVAAGLPLAPAACMATLQALYQYHPEKIWGRYGFVDALNVDKDWFDPDVIGIDLGMALVAIENQRTGLIWRLVGALPSTQCAYKQAGLHPTHEAQPRPLHLAVSPMQENIKQEKIEKTSKKAILPPAAKPITSRLVLSS